MKQKQTSLGKYEIRVHGLLGPLLLSTLPHTAAARVESHSLLITRSTDGPDLVELMETLVGSGLEVESIRAVSREASADHPT